MVKHQPSTKTAQSLPKPGIPRLHAPPGTSTTSKLLSTLILAALITPSYQASKIAVFFTYTLPYFLKLLILILVFPALSFFIFKSKKIKKKAKFIYIATISIILGFILIVKELDFMRNAGCSGGKVVFSRFDNFGIQDQFFGFKGFGSSFGSGKNFRCYKAPHPKYGIAGILGNNYISGDKRLEGKIGFFGKIRKFFGNLFSLRRRYGAKEEIPYTGIQDSTLGYSSLSPPSRWSIKGLLGSAKQHKSGIQGADSFLYNFKDWEICQDSENQLFNLHRVLTSGIAKIVLEMPDRLLRDEGIREVIENMGIREQVQVIDMRGPDKLYGYTDKGKKILKNEQAEGEVYVSDVPFLGAVTHHEIIQYNFRKNGQNVLWVLANEDSLEPVQLRKLEILAQRLLNDPLLMKSQGKKRGLLGRIFGGFGYVLSFFNPISYLPGRRPTKKSTDYNPHPIYETEKDKMKKIQETAGIKSKKWYQFWKRGNSKPKSTKEQPTHHSNYQQSYTKGYESNSKFAQNRDILSIIVSTNSNKVLDELSKSAIFKNIFSFVSCHDRRQKKVAKFFQEKIYEFYVREYPGKVIDRLDVEKEVQIVLEITGGDFPSLKTMVWKTDLDYLQGNLIDDAKLLENLKNTKFGLLSEKPRNYVLAYLTRPIQKLLKLRETDQELYVFLELLATRVSPKKREVVKNRWLDMSDVWEVLDMGDFAKDDRVYGGGDGGTSGRRISYKALEMAVEGDWTVRNNEKLRFREDAVFWVLNQHIFD